ncbi:hypothetical protein, partial [Sphingobacterium multivorum]|uniref:hypothetical protein n=1 Tax=Sphingobacterium multivorum TaxID=28454 RepID=UPI00289F78F6
MVAGLLPFAEQLPMRRAHRRSYAAKTDRRRICNSIVRGNTEVLKRKKPLTVSSKGFRVKKGTDLL